MIAGLCLWWNEGVDIEVLWSRENFIDSRVTDLNSGHLVKITWTYVDSVFEKRIKKREFLKNVGRDNQLPRLCIGDFNEIACSHEKWRKSER